MLINDKQLLPLRRNIDPYRLRRKMVDYLVRCGIQDGAVLSAMNTVPRHLFVDEALASRAYDNSTLPIGLGQTISHPYTVAKMTELLHVKSGMRVLEVGTGSGYQAAILSCLGCVVYTTERLPELYKRSVQLFSVLKLNKIRSFFGDGTLGLPEAAPYDRIIVTAGGPKVPVPLVEQLDEKGIMLIPVGERPRKQRLRCLVKDGGAFFEQDYGPAVFVDLVGNHGW